MRCFHLISYLIARKPRKKKSSQSQVKMSIRKEVGRPNAIQRRKFTPKSDWKYLFVKVKQ